MAGAAILLALGDRRQCAAVFARLRNHFTSLRGKIRVFLITCTPHDVGAIEPTSPSEFSRLIAVMEPCGRAAMILPSRI